MATAASQELGLNTELSRSFGMLSNRLETLSRFHPGAIGRLNDHHRTRKQQPHDTNMPSLLTVATAAVTGEVQVVLASGERGINLSEVAGVVSQTGSIDSRVTLSLADLYLAVADEIDGLVDAKEKGETIDLEYFDGASGVINTLHTIFRGSKNATLLKVVEQFEPVLNAQRVAVLGGKVETGVTAVVRDQLSQESLARVTKAIVLVQGGIKLEILEKQHGPFTPAEMELLTALAKSEQVKQEAVLKAQEARGDLELVQRKAQENATENLTLQDREAAARVEEVLTRFHSGISLDDALKMTHPTLAPLMKKLWAVFEQKEQADRQVAALTKQQRLLVEALKIDNLDVLPLNLRQAIVDYALRQAQGSQQSWIDEGRRQRIAEEPSIDRMRVQGAQRALELLREGKPLKEALQAAQPLHEPERVLLEAISGLLQEGKALKDAPDAVVNLIKGLLQNDPDIMIPALQKIPGIGNRVQEVAGLLVKLLEDHQEQEPIQIELKTHPVALRVIQSTDRIEIPATISAKEAPLILGKILIESGVMTEAKRAEEELAITTAAQALRSIDLSTLPVADPVLATGMKTNPKVWLIEQLAQENLGALQLQQKKVLMQRLSEALRGQFPDNPDNASIRKLLTTMFTPSSIPQEMRDVYFQAIMSFVIKP